MCFGSRGMAPGVVDFELKSNGCSPDPDCALGDWRSLFGVRSVGLDEATTPSAAVDEDPAFDSGDRDEGDNCVKY